MKITVYSTPGCSQCTMTKNWLVREGIAFDPVDLSQSPDDMVAIKALGYASAPVVVVNLGDTQDEKHWYGFRPDLLEEFTLIKEAA